MRHMLSKGATPASIPTRGPAPRRRRLKAPALPSSRLLIYAKNHLCGSFVALQWENTGEKVTMLGLIAALPPGLLHGVTNLTAKFMEALWSLPLIRPSCTALFYALAVRAKSDWEGEEKLYISWLFLLKMKIYSVFKARHIPIWNGDQTRCWIMSQLNGA